MKKYKVPVTIIATASHTIGEVEVDSIEEFKEKAEELWEELGFDHPTVNISNDFDLGDWEMNEVEERDLDYYLNE